MTSDPEICGYYSVTADCEYEDSISSLRYYRPPRLPIDLNRGIQDVKEKKDLFWEKKLNMILRFLVKHKHEYLNNKKPVKDGRKLIPSVDFITSRSALKLIMCSTVDSWNILATKYKGNIYLCKYLGYEKIEEENRNPIYTTFSHYGQMFQHYCLSEHPTKRLNTSEGPDPNISFVCVIKRNLVNRRLLYGTQMDAAYSDAPLDPENPRMWKTNQFVKLKLNIELTTTRRSFTFQKQKMPYIWALCFLSGIEQTHFGFRDENGIVWQKRRYSLNELEQISRECWEGSKSAFEFLEYFLENFEKDLKDTDCPYTTIKYHYDVNSKQLYSIRHEGKSKYSILPDWYIEEMRSEGDTV